MSSILPKTFLDDVKARLRLSDIVGRRLKLTRKGREFAACCPFHTEKSPSFYVNDEKEFFHCFGCGAHGDHFGFVMRNDNLDFMEAVERLAAEAGVTVPRPSPAEAQRLSRHDHLLRMMDGACSWFQSQLDAPEGKVASDYLNKRGIKPETRAAFRLGYAPRSGDALLAHMKKLGASDADLIDLGLFKKSTRDGGGVFAFFRDRVLFPVTDKRGRVIAYGGRILTAQSEDTGPKYLNSGETALFQKGQTLYNESNARAAAYNGKPVIVVEGYMDVIALWQAGFIGAVAPLGTALTEGQIFSLWDMCARGKETDGVEQAYPYLCFDGDAAGGRAALRAMDRMMPLLTPGRTAGFVFLPDNMDPDDLIKAKGEAAFGRLLAEAKPFVEVVWEAVVGGRAYKTPESRAGLQQKIEDRVAAITDKSVQSEYRRALKERFFDRIAGIKKFPLPGQAGKAVKASGIKPPKANFLDDARLPLLLGLVVQDPGIFFQVEEELGSLSLTNPRWDGMRQKLLEILGDDDGLDPAAIRAALQPTYAPELAVMDDVLPKHALHLFRTPDTRKSVALFRAVYGKVK